jgi:hypothetical protein
MNSDMIGALIIGALIALGYWVHRTHDNGSVVRLTEDWIHDGIRFSGGIGHAEHDRSVVDGDCYACRYLMEKSGVDLTPRRGSVMVRRFDGPLDEVPAEVLMFDNVEQVHQWVMTWSLTHGGRTCSVEVEVLA